MEKERSDRFKAGIEIRKTIMGEEYINSLFDVADGFFDEVQELATESWGTVWSRPGLSLRDRSLLEIGILTALNYPTELRTHIVGAIHNGVTESEVHEALLQTVAHCGFPAAVSGFKVARGVFQNYEANLVPNLAEQGWDDTQKNNKAALDKQTE